MLAACASLLEVAKSALTDFVVIYADARTVRDQVVDELKNKMGNRDEQNLDEDQAERVIQKLILE